MLSLYFQAVLYFGTKNKITVVFTLNEEIIKIGKFSQYLFISLAQMEREQISERTKNGYVGMLEEGKYPFGGKGISKTKDKRLYYNEDIEKIKNIFDLYSKGYNFSYIRKRYEYKYKIKIGKNFIEKIIKNNLYKGYISYNDKTYNFLSNITEHKNIKKNKNRQELFLKHNYKLKNMMKDNVLVETQRKKIKITGEIKEYKYYKHKIYKNINLEENKLIKQIEEKIKDEKINISSEKEKYIYKLNEMYLYCQLSIIDYNKLYESLENKYTDNILISNIKELKILKDYMVEFKIKNRTYKFKYKNINKGILNKNVV